MSSQKVGTYNLCRSEEMKSNNNKFSKEDFFPYACIIILSDVFICISLQQLMFWNTNLL